MYQPTYIVCYRKNKLNLACIHGITCLGGSLWEVKHITTSPYGQKNHPTQRFRIHRYRSEPFICGLIASVVVLLPGCNFDHNLLKIRCLVRWTAPFSWVNSGLLGETSSEFEFQIWNMRSRVKRLPENFFLVYIFWFYIAQQTSCSKAWCYSCSPN